MRQLIEKGGWVRVSNMRSHNLSENSEEPCTSFHHRYRPLSQLANREWPRNNMFPILSHIENSPLPDCCRLTVDHCHCQYWPFLSHSPLVTEEEEEDSCAAAGRKRVRIEKLRSKDFLRATLGRHRTSGGDMKTVSTRPCRETD